MVPLHILAAFACAMNMIVMCRATRRQSAFGFQFSATVFAAVFVLVLLPVSGSIFGSTSNSRLPDQVPLMVILSGALAMLAFLFIAFSF